MAVVPTRMQSVSEELAQQAINSIRFLAVDAVQKANSGHPGMPMGCAPMAYLLWSRYLRHNPSNPSWADRDRFVLSAGHGSMLLYGLLHLTGYDLSMDDIKSFRQMGSKTPGHPENFVTPGVETTTGPLGQGFANAVGMALAESYMAAHFNRPGFEVVDHHTYAIASDGDLMEGVSHEAASLAGHLGLGKLVVLYDDNGISIDGSTSLTYSENVRGRFEAYGWHVEQVADGNDLEAIGRAIDAARAETAKPSIIAIRTVIGFGSPNKQDTAAAHGSPLGPDEVSLTKKALGWPDKTFYVPQDVYTHMNATAAGSGKESEWLESFERYRLSYPELASQFERWMDGDLNDGWQAAIPAFETGSKLATRAASGKVIDAIGQVLPNLVGGSADLTGSNKTDISGRADMSASARDGGYIRFGVREHGMAAICNGMMLHGGVRPFCATFLVFTDYLRPALRLSALMGLPVVYVMTHDSIGLGEDGPTHQPIEHYMAVRAIPNVQFIRPADAGETADAWRIALETSDRPTILSLTRQGVPTLDRSRVPQADGVNRGAYVLRGDNAEPDIILLASGSEVAVALGAAELLEADGLSPRVVSMPCFELFERQPRSYRDEVLPPTVAARISIEAGVTRGWERYVGSEGRSIGIDRFGASAPAGELFEKFGITADRVAAVAREMLERVS